MKKVHTMTCSTNRTRTFLFLGVLLVLAGLVLFAGCSMLSSTGSPGKATQAVTPGSQGPLTITDSTGTEISLQKPAGRIVVVNSNAAELLLAIGAGDRIVGVSEAVRTNPALSGRLEKIPSIGDWQSPSIEEILALHPDLVIAYASSRPKNIDQITKTGVTIAAIDCYRLDTLALDARNLGILTGTREKADEYVKFLNRTTDCVRDRIALIPQKTRPRVYFESYSDYSAQGPGTGSHTLLTFAGGENIVTSTPSASVKVSPEWIVSQNPDAFIKVLSAQKFHETGSAEWDKILARPGMENITAVRNQKYYILINDVAYGPRSFAGLVTLAKIFYPDRFTDLDPTALIHEYEQEFFPKSDPGQLTIPPLANPGNV